MGDIHPHLIRYWLHSSEEMDSPKTYTAKVNEICTNYQKAQAVHEAGGHTISVDEMTGIQVLEHKYPDKPVMPGKTAHTEFEYIHHGQPALSASLILPQDVWKCHTLTRHVRKKIS